MLRKISIYSLILMMSLVMVLGVSCKKNERQPSSETYDFGIDINDVSGKWQMGYVLRLNSGLYTMDEDTGNDTDLIKWQASLNLGDSIMTGETRKATYDKTVYDVIEVRTNTGREGFALATQIAVGGNLAVVVDEKANLFRTPNAIDVTGSIISRRTVLVYYPETESNGLVEIRAYDPEARANRHGNFVKFSSLSTRTSDIQSSILLQAALPLRVEVAAEKNRREALLETALLDYSDSVFFSEIFEIANPAPIVNETVDYEEEDSMSLDQ